ARKRICAKRAESTRVSAASAPESPNASPYARVLATLKHEQDDPRIALQDGKTGTWQIVNRNAIDWIRADGSSRVLVRVGAETFPWRKTLTELEARARSECVFADPSIIHCKRWPHPTSQTAIEGRIRAHPLGRHDCR